MAKIAQCMAQALYFCSKALIDLGELQQLFLLLHCINLSPCHLGTEGAIFLVQGLNLQLKCSNVVFQSPDANLSIYNLFLQSFDYYTGRYLCRLHVTML